MLDAPIGMGCFLRSPSDGEIGALNTTRKKEERKKEKKERRKKERKEERKQRKTEEKKERKKEKKRKISGSTYMVKQGRNHGNL